jgi:release factor glutamine methyltransferase
VAASFEPVEALDGGGDGLDLVRRLLEGLPEVLAPAGTALLEIGGDHAGPLTEAASVTLPEWVCTIHEDLSGSPRVVQLDRPRG